LRGTSRGEVSIDVDGAFLEPEVLLGADRSFRKETSRGDTVSSFSSFVVTFLFAAEFPGAAKALVEFTADVNCGVVDVVLELEGFGEESRVNQERVFTSPVLSLSIFHE